MEKYTLMAFAVVAVVVVFSQQVSGGKIKGGLKAVRKYWWAPFVLPIPWEKIPIFGEEDYVEEEEPQNLLMDQHLSPFKLPPAEYVE
ncbi:hypothetical protein ScPMuIL_003232 [Solemya velum]